MSASEDLERQIRICLERKIPVRVQYGPRALDRYQGLVVRFDGGTVAIRVLMGDLYEIDFDDIVKFEPQ